MQNPQPEQPACVPRIKPSMSLIQSLQPVVRRRSRILPGNCDRFYLGFPVSSITDCIIHAPFINMPHGMRWMIGFALR